MTSKELQLCRQNNFQIQQNDFEEFANLYITTYRNSRPYYLHILVCHAVDMWYRFPFSFPQLSNQGTEALNKGQQEIVDIIGCNGGLGRNASYQYMLFQIRLLIYQSEYYYSQFKTYATTCYNNWIDQTIQIRKESKKNKIGNSQQASKPKRKRKHKFVIGNQSKKLKIGKSK